MSLSRKPQTFVVIIILVVVLGVGAFAGYTLMTSPPPADDMSIKITTLENAGVLIEADGSCIYIDPI
ncbi:MAG: hypothetical protein ACFFDQ_14310, partial [Candidatus Thorarchaeota archaeon]